MPKVELQLDQNTGGSGTVTSVGLTMPSEFLVANSPVTGSDTIAVTFDNQSPRLVFASPASGGAGQPSFRNLETDDMPNTAIQGQFINITRQGTIPNNNTAQFIGVVADVGSTAGSQFTTTEAAVQCLCPYSIVLTSLRVRTGNTAPANITINIRVALNNVGNTLTINQNQPAGTYTQNQPNVAVAQDALINIRALCANAGSTNAQINSIVILYRYA